MKSTACSMPPPTLPRWITITDMPFIPHTEADVHEMLNLIGAPSTEVLFDEIPEALRCKGLLHVPERLSEMEVTRLMHGRAAQDGSLMNFCGAGAYEHHIPAAVWEITARGEFYSAYTPFQAEASQGTLQLLYEYQSMICALTGMEVSNASMYDGASALAEALLMAMRTHPRPGSRPNSSGGPTRVLMPASVNPFYRDTVESITAAQGIELVCLDFDSQQGRSLASSLEAHAGGEFTAVVIQQPNFFGVLEDVDALTDWAHAQGALVVGVVNPVSLALLKPPSEWGSNGAGSDGAGLDDSSRRGGGVEASRLPPAPTLRGTVSGADIVCGDGQPLGAPLSSGGPYFGFLGCRQKFVRQMPGRIVGRTVDLDGNPGYTLTLQAREQHIRRSKATSNICSNQGLMVTAATIHMTLLGPQGLERVAAQSVANTQMLVERLSALPGVTPLFAGDHFHEAVLQLPRPVDEVLAALADHGILGGYDLSRHYPQLGAALLVCATETRTHPDIEHYAETLTCIISTLGEYDGQCHPAWKSRHHLR